MHVCVLRPYVLATAVAVGVSVYLIPVVPDLLLSCRYLILVVPDYIRSHRDWVLVLPPAGGWCI
mgnify:FL=1